MQDIFWIDITLATIIGWSMVVGLFRGLIRGIFGFISLALAFICARQYGSVLESNINSFVGQSLVSTISSYTLAFIFFLIIFSLCTLMLQKIIHKADLGMLDKTGGLLFGFLRGAFFALLLVGIFALFPLQSVNAWNKSHLVPIFGSVIKTFAHSSLASDYQHYWEFDEENRPQFVLRDAAIENIENIQTIQNIAPLTISDSNSNDNDSDESDDNINTDGSTNPQQNNSCEGDNCEEVN